MARGEVRIPTSHVGALPPPADWGTRRERLARARGAAFENLATPIVRDLVDRQIDIGIDRIGDGEFWAGRGFMSYAEHLSGVTVRPLRSGEHGAMREFTRERDVFPALYADMDRVQTLYCTPGERPFPRTSARMIVTGPLEHRGLETLRREIDVFSKAVTASGRAVGDAFICALAPGWLDHFIYNEFYARDEDFVQALADAMRAEYRAIVDAGFLLQIDDPGIATTWDMVKPEPTDDAYRAYTNLRIDALNHALAGIPEERVRYHFCWGSWHGAHTNDVPLRKIVDLVLRVRAGCYSFEAGNVRHEHEWRVWDETPLPKGRSLMPGVVSHATNIVEHPRLVADRLLRLARLVGPERIVAGTDCGLGDRVHPEIVWAKLAALVEGARLASAELS